MASSLQTLVKILRLEQDKGYQNNAVIGGFARFAYHWSREAHGQAKTDTHHALVDRITEMLRDYENASVEERPALVETIMAVATGETDAPAPQAAAPQPISDDIGIGDPDAGEDDPLDPFAEGEDDLERFEEKGTSVRERRGYAWRQEPPLIDLSPLDAPVTSLRGVGPKRAGQLARLGAETVGDLLRLFPRRYDDFSTMKFIQDLELGETVSVIGMLDRVDVHQARNGRGIVRAALRDKSGVLNLTWFNSEWLAKQLLTGEPYVVSGTIDQYLGRLVMNNPRIESLDADALHAGRIVPIYPLTEGLSDKQMRSLMKGVVDTWAMHLPDPLPVWVRETADLMDYGDAVAQCHFPDSQQDAHDARRRLAFDELFTLHLSMLKRRMEWQSLSSPPLIVDDTWVDAFEETLPYTFTGAQRRAIAEIQGDMAQSMPMNRLLQGDVGSGKTVVAALAASIAVANGTQVALMAPTSILTEQHHQTISMLLAQIFGEDVHVALLTGRLTQRQKDEVYAGLADGSIDVVVGTHALVQPGVAFRNLGLAVIDEQHRFGVAQRGALREKANGGNPHLLVMTATPIPRTLALTAHADLDLTVIDEMPPGRQPVQTRVLQPKERERVYQYIRGQVAEGRQAYIIYPLVEESENSTGLAATSEYERLQNEVFPDLTLGLVHGRMNSADKDGVMQAFYEGEIHILVSTTVIEVGVNVPNATIMVVENAPRFGLSQLHQLRGRVGRGAHQSYCVLISDKAFLTTDDRLSILEETNDGFEVARVDLARRGAGDLLRLQQSGGHLEMADMMDLQLIEEAQRAARALLDQDPMLRAPEHAMLADKVIEPEEYGDIS